MGSDDGFRDYLEAALERAADAVYVIDAEGRFEFVNARGRELHGRTLEEFRGRSFLETAPPADHARAREFFAQVLAGERKALRTSVERGGRAVVVDVTLHRVDWEGRSRVLAVARDVTDMVQAASDLRRTTEEMRALLATVPDLYFRLDPEGRILDYHASNPEDLFRRPEDFLGRRMAEVVPPAAGAAIASALEKALKSGQTTSCEYALPMARGEQTFEARLVPYRSGEALAFVRNRTHRKRDERRLAAQYEVTRALAEAPTLKAAAPRILESLCRGLGRTAGGLWRVEPGAREIRCVEFWSDPASPVPAFERLSRDSRFAPGIGLPGMVWVDPKPLWLPDVVHADNFPRAATAVREGLHAAFAAPIRLGDQVLGVIELFSREVLPPDEDLLMMMTGVGSQIGQFIERRRAEQEVQYQKSVLESQSEASIDGILVVSPDGAILSYNRRFAQMWGIPDRVLKKRSDRAALDHVMPQLENPGAFLKKVRAIYDDPREESQDEFRLKDGRTIERYSAPVTAEDGTLHGRVWYFREVTARKLAEAEQRRTADEARRALLALKRAQAQLVRSEKLALAGMLVSGVAHEINNPINVVHGNLKLLRDRCDAVAGVAKGGAPTAAARRALASVPAMLRDALKAAEVARDIIREFRNFARDPRSAEPADLNRCVEETLSIAKKDLEGLKIRRRLGRIPPVRCFRGQLNQVILNLVKNAAEAMEGRGTLTVATSVRARRVTISVADTGPGIPVRDRERIFDPFFTTKEGGRGMGLGLAISATIVENHGGRLRVAGRRGRGATFSVELPASPGKETRLRKK